VGEAPSWLTTKQESSPERLTEWDHPNCPLRTTRATSVPHGIRTLHLLLPSRDPKSSHLGTHGTFHFLNVPCFDVGVQPDRGDGYGIGQALDSRKLQVESLRRIWHLYTILQLPVLCGIYCNNGGSGGNVILRNSAGDDGVGWDI